jgi:hypothetical protein
MVIAPPWLAGRVSHLHADGPVIAGLDPDNGGSPAPEHSENFGR